MKTFIFVLIFAGLLIAKSYELSAVNITAHLQPDGSMQVKESRTYHFDGDFSFAFRTFPKTGDHTFRDLRVSEYDMPYKQADTQLAGTYRLTETEKQTEIRWYYKAQSEVKTFDIYYTVDNIIDKYRDAAVLYFQFISNEWEQPTGKVLLKIYPPTNNTSEKPLVWLHAPLHGNVQIVENGIITAECSPLPKHKIFEIRALYSPAQFPSLASSQGGYIKSTILQEEKAWAEKANRLREAAILEQAKKEQRQYYGKYIIWSIALLSLWIWWQLFQKYGKRPTIPQTAKIRGDAPSQTAPAELSYLYYDKTISGTAIVSTLLHLAQRKFLKLKEIEKQKGKRKKIEYVWNLDRDFYKKNKSELLDYENDVIVFLFDELAEGADEITFKMIEKKSTKFAKFFEKWHKKVKKHAKENNWWDDTANTGMWWGLGLSLLLMGLTIVAAFLVGMWAFLLGMMSIFILIGSLLIQHRTRDGQILYNEWKAFKRYMQKYEFRNTGFDGLQNQLNAFFVYAPLFGMSTKFYKELANKIPIDQAQLYLYWYFFHGNQAQFSPETLGASISTMMTATTTVMSSATGAGGGASAGGGGGASAGGGGVG